ncbi:TRAP transporter large permease [Enterovirga sp. CN4-39]|uniref:TRAP transporter large permease n=1 Tax=Enterovirga sp. CN4-39 TaxID=3400910 RepID=UPI003C1022E3
MGDPALGLVMLGLIVVAIMMGFPTAFTLMGLGMMFGFYAFYVPGQALLDNRIFDLMVQRTYGAMTNDVLIAIPLFVLMGYVMERGALVDKMFYSVQLAFRRVPASLAVTTLAVCAFWGMATGLVGAVVVLMGVVALQPMLRAGYDTRIAAGVITAGGTLGILIPPSVMIIVYAAVAGQSVVKLYAAAMFPGLFLAFLYILYVIGRTMLNPSLAPALPEEATRIPVPDWIRRFQTVYPMNMVRGLAAALASPAKALSISTDAGPIRYRHIVGNFAASLIPLGLVAGILSLWWWYVVVYPFARVEEVPEGLEQLGAPAAAPVAAEVSVSTTFYVTFGVLAVVAVLALARYYARMTAEKLQVVKLLSSSVLPMAILIALVLGAILLGITTATESAAIGAAGAFLLALFARTLNWKRTKEAVFLTAKTTAMVCWLFVGSALFSAVFALLGGQALLERWVLSLDLTPTQFMLLSQAIIFILGWPLEWTEIIIIFVPIFLPLLQHFGIDPILWGVLVFVNLQAAFLSPPVAMSAFYLRGVAPPHVTLNQIFAGMMPYMAVVVLCMIIIYLWPGMALWLPEYLYGK